MPIPKRVLMDFPVHKFVKEYIEDNDDVVHCILESNLGGLDKYRGILSRLPIAEYYRKEVEQLSKKDEVRMGLTDLLESTLKAKVREMVVKHRR